MIHRLAVPSPSLITLIGHVLWRALHFLSVQHRRQLEGKALRLGCRPGLPGTPEVAGSVLRPATGSTVVLRFTHPFVRRGTPLEHMPSLGMSFGVSCTFCVRNSVPGRRRGCRRRL